MAEQGVTRPVSGAAPAGYAGATVALLTQHGKERVIAPVLEPALGCSIQLVSGFDTDLLGTFTRETPRPGSQLEAARRKARKGMELSGLRIGLASEGSFCQDPFAGMFPWNVELLLWVDDTLGLEITGMAQGAARSGHTIARTWDELATFAARSGFPAHHLVLRPNDENDPRVHKGIQTEAALQTAFEACHEASHHGDVFAELDLRAFANPTRMDMIKEAAADLSRKLQSACPACSRPGFWVTERQPGLPCSACLAQTRIHRSEVWSCVGCTHREVRPRTDRLLADPSDCPRCNP